MGSHIHQQELHKAIENSNAKRPGQLQKVNYDERCTM